MFFFGGGGLLELNLVSVFLYILVFYVQILKGNFDRMVIMQNLPMNLPPWIFMGITVNEFFFNRFILDNAVSIPLSLRGRGKVARFFSPSMYTLSVWECLRHTQKLLYNYLFQYSCVFMCACVIKTVGNYRQMNEHMYAYV